MKSLEETIELLKLELSFKDKLINELMVELKKYKELLGKDLE